VQDSGGSLCLLLWAPVANLRHFRHRPDQVHQQEIRETRSVRGESMKRKWERNASEDDLLAALQQHVSPAAGEMSWTSYGQYSGLDRR
jgi:hypothetical protein